jgi:UMF1 family MFS transporter
MQENKILTEKQFKKERISWYFYDFANSVFSTSLITVFLGPYFTSIAENAANSNGNIDLFLFKIAAGSFYPLIVSISVILQVIFLPFIASIADNTRYKKQLLFLSAYIGAFATMGLFFVEGTNYALGGILFIIANINFGLSCTIYNSYLNHISTSKNINSISSIGWALGYIGGGILLVLNLFFFNNAENYGISTEFAIRICLASAGIWWAIFTLIPLKYLRNIIPKNSLLEKKNIAKQGITSLTTTIKDAKKYPQTLLFLLAYMLYNDGVQSVISLASQFGSAELGLKIDVLITAILLVQVVAFIGSLFFNIATKYVSTLSTLKITIFIWILAIFFAYFFMYSAFDFYIVCCVVGFVMGGTQALSRSIYSQLIPIGKEAEYFSIYELSEKGTSWLGPLIFALVYNFTTSYRIAIISLISFFILGFILLFKFNFEKGKQP